MNLLLQCGRRPPAWPRGEEVALSRSLRGRSTSPFQGISMNPSPVCSSWDAFSLPSTIGTALTIHDTSTFCIPQHIEGPRRVPTQAPQRETPSIKCHPQSTHASLYIIVGDAELLRPCTCSYHPRCRAPRIAHSKVLTSGQRRSPRRRSQHLAAVSLGLACLRARSCALVRPSDKKSESATCPHTF